MLTVRKQFENTSVFICRVLRYAAFVEEEKILITQKMTLKTNTTKKISRKLRKKKTFLTKQQFIS
jgi:hypothetical protein